MSTTHNMGSRRKGLGAFLRGLLRIRSIHANLILALLCTESRGQELHVYLDTDDCVRHLALVRPLKQLSSEVRITYFCPAENRAILPLMLSRFGMDTAKVEMAEVGSLKDMHASDCALILPNGATLDFTKQDLGRVVRTLNRLYPSATVIDTLALDPRTTLSNRVNYYPGRNEVILSDYLTSKNYRLNIEGTEGILSDLDLDTKLKVPMLLKKGVDTTFYASHHSEMVDFGLGEVTLGCASYSGDTLCMVVGLAVPGLRIGEEKSGITGFNALVRCFGDARMEFEIIDPLIPADSAYIYTMSHALNYEGGSLTLSLVKRESSTTPDELLATLRINNGTWSFSELIGFKKPAYFDSTGYRYNMTLGVFNANLYGMRHYPVIFNAKTRRTIDLRAGLSEHGLTTVDLNSTQTYYCYDLHLISDGLAELAFRMDNQDQLAIIDLHSGSIRSISSAEFSGCDKDSIRFLSDGRLFSLSSDRRSILIL